MARDYEALLGFIAERSAMPFRWGRRRNDCVAFAAGAAKAQTGTDPLGDLNWRTFAEGRALLKALGGMRKAVDARLPRVAPAMAKRGDIAGVPDRRLGTRLMVIEGATLVAPGKRRAERLPRSAMVCAWTLDSIEDGAA